jgi:hypothetical protein
MVASARSWWLQVAIGGKKRAQLQVQIACSTTTNSFQYVFTNEDAEGRGETPGPMSLETIDLPIAPNQWPGRQDSEQPRCNRSV